MPVGVGYSNIGNKGSGGGFDFLGLLGDIGIPGAGIVSSILAGLFGYGR